MTELVPVIKRGFWGGLRVLWDLIKVVVPAYFIVSLLTVSGAMEWLGRWLAPVMGLVGLPGEAAVPFAAGAFINLYSLLGAVAPLHMTAKQVTVLCGMSLMAHGLIMEGLVLHKSGGNIAVFTCIRLVAAFLFGLLLNAIL